MLFLSILNKKAISQFRSDVFGEERASTGGVGGASCTPLTFES